MGDVDSRRELPSFPLPHGLPSPENCREVFGEDSSPDNPFLNETTTVEPGGGVSPSEGGRLLVSESPRLCADSQAPAPGPRMTWNLHWSSSLWPWVGAGPPPGAMVPGWTPMAPHARLWFITVKETAISAKAKQLGEGCPEEMRRKRLRASPWSPTCVPA